jgi:hypothetical protein
MSYFFNPANPYYRRGVYLTACFFGSLSVVNGVLSDYGRQEHVFSPVQRYLCPKIDWFFGVSEEDLNVERRNYEARRDAIKLKYEEKTR